MSFGRKLKGIEVVMLREINEEVKDQMILLIYKPYISKANKLALKFDGGSDEYYMHMKVSL